jgi:hypothetical protein
MMYNKGTPQKNLMKPGYESEQDLILGKSGTLVHIWLAQACTHDSEYTRSQSRVAASCFLVGIFSFCITT